jgi:hypothetical protein
MKIVPLLVAVAATVSLAACGAAKDPSKTSSSGKPSQEAANKKAMLAYASCMRKNGVDMPDPQFSGGRVTQKMNAPSNPDKMRTAEKACSKYRAQLKAPDMSDAEKEEFKKGALANARCMREHGIDNFPDPTFGADGGAQIKIDGSINPESAKFKKAQEACKGTMRGPSTTTAGGGEER